MLNANTCLGPKRVELDTRLNQASSTDEPKLGAPASPSSIPLPTERSLVAVQQTAFFVYSRPESLSPPLGNSIATSEAMGLSDTSGQSPTNIHPQSIFHSQFAKAASIKPSSRICKNLNHGTDLKSRELVQLHLSHTEDNIRFNQQYKRADWSSLPVPAQAAVKITVGVESLACQQNGAAGSIKNSSNKTASPVLYVKGVDPKRITIHELSNLFSNYGNVRGVLMHMRKDFALVEYTTVQGATFGLQYLNKISVFGFKLTILFSKYHQIDCSTHHNPDEYFCPDPRLKRFRLEVPSTPNPISRTLHLCFFIPRESPLVSQDDILALVSPISTCVRLQRDENSHHGNMWFLDFKSIADSTRVLVQLHDADYLGGNIRVSFTRSRKSAL